MRTLAICTFLSVSILGCASPHKTEPQAAVEPDLRRAHMLEDFEENRTAAIYKSAITRWQRGDSVGCKDVLVRLLDHSPDHTEARRTLADLYVELGDMEAAERQMRILLDRDPDDAQAHHSLGLLMESVGKKPLAAEQFARAVELEPTNELFALSRESCRANNAVSDDSDLAEDDSEDQPATPSAQRAAWHISD